MTEMIYPEMPPNTLVVLIGPSGAGKSTIARAWPASQVLSLDALREIVSDDAGDQSATRDAVEVDQEDDDHDQDDDFESHADLEAQALEAVSG